MDCLSNAWEGLYNSDVLGDICKNRFLFMPAKLIRVKRIKKKVNLKLKGMLNN